MSHKHSSHMSINRPRKHNPIGENFFKVCIEPLVRNKIDKKEYVLLKALILCNASEFFF
ncbi:hypothetical protein ANCCAN_09878 [Ancylostoma caninum]|uniref:Uncharacterized protein n=1 Tax=Ancylostoma caninum TaxID=29170 RepID=A0A368GIA0_ANCCA|nr:hypothetical protein ANCCAN_09878 [Ancylostoma caninum]